MSSEVLVEEWLPVAEIQAAVLNAAGRDVLS